MVQNLLILPEKKKKLNWDQIGPNNRQNWKLHEPNPGKEGIIGILGSILNLSRF